MKKLRLIAILLLLNALIYSTSTSVQLIHSIDQAKKSNTVTFSATKDVNREWSSSLLEIPVYLSLDAQLSLKMPVTIYSTTNTTTSKNGTAAALYVAVSRGQATASIKISLSISVGDLSKDFSKTITSTFRTPIGTFQSTFSTISVLVGSIPMVGEVTLDFTPRLSLYGNMSARVNVEGPADIDIKNLSWDAESTNSTLNISFKENSKVYVKLNSMVLSLEVVDFSVEVGATVKFLGSSNKYSVGIISLPISSSFTADASPNSVTIAQYTPPRSLQPIFPISFSSTSLSWLFIFITVLAIINMIIVAIKKRRLRHTLTSRKPNKVRE